RPAGSANSEGRCKTDVAVCAREARSARRRIRHRCDVHGRLPLGPLVDLPDGPGGDESPLRPGRYAPAVPGRFASRVSLSSRERKLRLFLDLYQPGPATTVVDVGVTDAPFGAG